MSSYCAATRSFGFKQPHVYLGTHFRVSVQRGIPSILQGGLGQKWDLHHWKRSSPIVRGNAIRNKADGDHEVSNSGELITPQLTNIRLLGYLSEPIPKCASQDKRGVV